MQIRSWLNEANFNQKTAKSIVSWSNHSLNLFSNVFVTLKNEKNSTQNLSHRWKKLFPINEATTFINTVKKSVSNFLHFCLKNIWAPVQDLYASQKIQVLSSLRRPVKLFRHRQGHERAGALTGSIYNKGNPLLPNIETKRQLSFASWVLKNISNLPSKICCLLSVLFGHFLSEYLDFRTFRINSTGKRQRALPFTYDPVVFTIQ